MKDFKYGIKEINKINSKFNTTIESYPKSTKEIDNMLADFVILKSMTLEKDQKPFDYVIRYRIVNLEAEKLYIEGFKYGDSSTTKKGFACKPRPLITESVVLRNKSALKGFEAVDLLREFVSKYPNHAELANLSSKNALFLNATYYQIEKEARRDSNIINNFCPKNVTLELYQQEFRKKTNYSEEYITSLSFEDAVKIWKNLRGIE